MRLCLAIRSEDGIQALLAPYTTCGVNWSFLVDMNGAHLRPLHATSATSALVQVG